MNQVRIFFIVTVITLPFLTLSQLKIVSSDNVFIRMNGGNSANPIYLVVDESNDTVFVESTPGRKLISENQYNVIRWLIGDNSGNYIIPFNETNTSAYDPVGVEMEINSPGNVGGYVDFSSYSTSVNNLPLPDGVSNLDHFDNTIPSDGEWVYDRFWRIDALNYSTIPSGVLSFEYAANEMTGNLTYGSSFLQAQQYDPVANTWGGLSGLLGTDNISGTVSGVGFTPSNLTPYWTLVEQITPLPVELTSFDVAWNNEKRRTAKIDWTTASEKNSDFFEVLRSADGISWQTILKVDGQGTTNSITEYKENDITPLSGISYYRLKQTSFDGEYTYSSIKSLYKEGNGEDVTVYPNPSSGSFQLDFTNRNKDNYTVLIINSSGKIVRSIKSKPDSNSQIVDISELSRGVYIISVLQNEFTAHKKLVVNH